TKELSGACAPPPVPRPEIAAILSAPLPETAAAAAAVSGNGTVERTPQRNGAGPPAGPADGDPRSRPDPSTVAEPAGGKAAPTGMPTGVPTPKDLAGLGPGRGSGSPPVQQPVPSATLRWSSDKGWVERSSGPGGGEPSETAALPTLAQLTSAEQRWADREEDITTVGGDPFEVGQVFARRWTERLSDTSHLQLISTEYPRIPHRIDGELLRYAARFGLLAHKDDQIDEHDRYAIRAGFWRELDSRTTAEHSPAGD
ncbi:NYN domain-containing protein, partial [Streptomyces sp. NPDC057654]